MEVIVATINKIHDIQRERESKRKAFLNSDIPGKIQLCTQELGEKERGYFLKLAERLYIDREGEELAYIIELLEGIKELSSLSQNQLGKIIISLLKLIDGIGSEIKRDRRRFY